MLKKLESQSRLKGETLATLYLYDEVFEHGSQVVSSSLCPLAS